MRKAVLVTLALMSFVAIAGEAFAQNRTCTTNCYGSGQYRTCTTQCY